MGAKQQQSRAGRSPPHQQSCRFASASSANRPGAAANLNSIQPSKCARASLYTRSVPPSHPPRPATPLRAGAHPNCTAGDCAFPQAWWKQNQTEYTALGNAGGKGLLLVAVSDYFPAGPTLYVTPGAWCDTEGAVANADNTGLVPKYSHRRAERRLLGGGDAPARAGPPSVSVNSGMACNLLGEDAVSFKVGDGAVQAAERVDGGAYKIALPNNLPDVSENGGAKGGLGGGVLGPRVVFRAVQAQQAAAAGA